MLNLSKEDKLFEAYKEAKESEIKSLKEQLEQYKKENDSKTELLDKLGISSMEEAKRISCVINEFRNENDVLREQIKLAEQDKLVLEKVLEHIKDLIVRGS